MDALTILAAFVIGSIPFGYWLPKRAYGVDIRTVGSGNVGFTNVYRAAGPAAGAAVLAADIGKGALAVALARFGGGGETLPVVAGLAAIAGHVWSPFLGFRGGKGVATTAGVFVTLLPVETAACLLLFLAVAGATRYVSLASIVAALALPVALLVGPRLGRPAATPADGAITILVAALILVRHRANVGRLLAGKENRFTWKRSGGGTR